MESLCRALSELFSMSPHPSRLSALTGSDVERPCLEGAVALGPVTPWFAYRTQKSINWHLFPCGLCTVLPAIGKAPDQAHPSLMSTGCYLLLPHNIWMTDLFINIWSMKSGVSQPLFRSCLPWATAWFSFSATRVVSCVVQMRVFPLQNCLLQFPLPSLWGKHWSAAVGAVKPTELRRHMVQSRKKQNSDAPGEAQLCAHSFLDALFEQHSAKLRALLSTFCFSI